MPTIMTISNVVKNTHTVVFRFGVLTQLIFGFFAHFGHCDEGVNNVAYSDPWEVFYGDNVQSRTVGCTGKCDSYRQKVEMKRSSTHTFCYTFPHCAPKTWMGLCKNGKFQSPIDLDIKSKKLIKKSHPKNFLSFDKVYKEDKSEFLITNNGLSITIYFNEEFTSKSTFSHTDTKLQYSFAQLHFHWSTKTPITTGSEHTLGMKRFPMEMHVVHYKTEYETMAKAVKENDNLALGVLGIFFEVGGEENLAMKPIVDAILEHSLKESAGTVTVKENINLFKLLPKDLRFFRYRGSLTIPACAEKLNWVVFTEAVEISKEQMSVFMQVEFSKEKDGKVKNYRPTQAINGRKIEYFG